MAASPTQRLLRRPPAKPQRPRKSAATVVVVIDAVDAVAIEATAAVTAPSAVSVSHAKAVVRVAAIARGRKPVVRDGGRVAPRASIAPTATARTVRTETARGFVQKAEPRIKPPPPQTAITRKAAPSARPVVSARASEAKAVASAGSVARVVESVVRAEAKAEAKVAAIVVRVPRTGRRFHPTTMHWSRPPPPRCQWPLKA